MIAEISPAASSLRNGPKQPKPVKQEKNFANAREWQFLILRARVQEVLEGDNAKRLDNLPPTHLSTWSQHTLHLFLVLCFIAKFHKFLLHGIMSTSISPISFAPINQLIKDSTLQLLRAKGLTKAKCDKLTTGWTS